MRQLLRSAVIAIGVLGLARVAAAQSATLDFEDGTDQGFGTSFGDDASKTFQIINIGGSNRMFVPRTGGFQEAGVGHGADGSPFYLAMQAAAANPAGYNISYDWYVDTSTFGSGAGTFLQLGTYVNTGSGYYAQDFPSDPPAGPGKEVTINGTQLASGQVFSGHTVVNFATAGYAMPPGDTFFRLGFIENGDGANQAVYFDNVTVAPVPEPATLALLGLGVPALVLRRRRRA